MGKAEHHWRETVGCLPFGPYVSGRQKVEQTLAGAASHYRDGEVVEVELIAKYVSETLACIVEVERGRAKVGGADDDQ